MAEAVFSEAEFALGVEKMRSISTSTPSAIKGLCSSIFSEPDSGIEDTTADSCFLTSTTQSCNYSFDSNSSLGLGLSSDRGLFYSPILKEQLTPSKQAPKEEHLCDWEIAEEENVFQKINTRITDIPCRNLSFDFCSSQDSGVHTSSPALDLPARFEQVLKAFSPPVLDRLIGRKMGLEKVDIISELSVRNVLSVSSILSYLNPQDLCSMCQVSKKWRKVVKTDSVASAVCRKFVKHNQEISLGKENSLKPVNSRSVRGLTVGSKFDTIQLIQCQRASTPHSKTSKADIFSVAADSLREGEELRHCPKCFVGAARILPGYERGTCFNNNCNFDFCSKCFSEYHGSKPCNPMSLCKKPKKDNVISSKKAKKNLKRLSAL